MSCKFFSSLASLIVASNLEQSQNGTIEGFPPEMVDMKRNQEP